MSIPSAKSQLLQELQRSLTPGPRNQAMAAPPPAYTYQPADPPAAIQTEDDHTEPDIEAIHSPINIKISSPITVIGDANLIAINPAGMASGLANCIVQSLRESSMARTGIPMIDEEGRPRPIDVQVDAGIIVRGSKNAIGKKAVLSDLRGIRDLKRKRAQTEDEDEQLNVEGNGGEETDTDERRKNQRLALSTE